jgi:hypothetical protein
MKNWLSCLSRNCVLLPVGVCLFIATAGGQPVYAPGQSVNLWVGCYGWPGLQLESCGLTVTANAWNVIATVILLPFTQLRSRRARLYQGGSAFEFTTILRTSTRRRN